MSKNLSSKYHHLNIIKKIKKTYKKKLLKDTKIFLRKKKKKRDNMIMNVIKLSQKNSLSR